MADLQAIIVRCVWDRLGWDHRHLEPPHLPSQHLYQIGTNRLSCNDEKNECSHLKYDTLVDAFSMLLNFLLKISHFLSLL